MNIETSFLSLTGISTPQTALAMDDPAMRPTAAVAASASLRAPRRSISSVAIILASAALHGLLALSMSRARAHEGPRPKPTSHVRITVTRPPEPVKAVEIPAAPTASPPAPRPAAAVKRKAPTAAAPPREQPAPEAPPPAAPPVAAVAATDPGAVFGSVEGALDGVGSVGGTKDGVGTALVAPAPPPPPPAVVIEAHEGAGYLKNPRPPYPEIARSRGWEGEVLLKVRVSPTGRAETVTVKRSSGRRLLDDAAIESVRGWTFVPASQGRVAIAGWVEVPLVFKLQ